MMRQRCASQHPAVITRQENSSAQESVALALQRVFYHLQHSNKSVGTMQLIKSFDKTIFDAFTQHEVQELDRVLCDNLEQKMKGTPVEKEVSRLFRGQLKNFVKCINVNFSSERVEDFYDLSLNVRGCKNLKESLEKYVEREKLDGDNKYMADLHGLQDAEKGKTFSSFPPVLHLHLKRFEYDPLRNANVKINDRFEFDEAIDLAPYMEELPGGPEIYQLHSVLVHCMPPPSEEAERERKREASRARIEATKTAKGEEVLKSAGGEHPRSSAEADVHGGHYHAYIRPDCKERWFKFNDEIVTVASREEAVESNYGLGEDADRTRPQALMIQRSRPALRRSSNACMLVYVKEQAVGDVLRPLVSLKRALREP
jgi:ubiquitin carboxyl-terminal hydrolase 7